MRILFATYSLAFQNPGGGEQVLLALEEALGARGHEITFYDPWKIEPRGFDVIHFFSCLENRFWKTAKRLSPVTPLVVTPVIYQQPGWKGSLDLYRSKFFEMLSRPRLGELPDLWLPTTESEAAMVKRRFGPRGAIRVLPNGIDALFAKADPTAFSRWLAQNSSVKSPFVLHVGRFHPVKNQLGLIEACKAARLPCVLIGGADLGQSEYHARCLAAGKDVATFTGPLRHDDPLLASAYAAAAVFALPSQFETFGISALEAAVTGAPLVLSERLQEKALFSLFEPLWVSPGDPAALAQAIQAAIQKGRAKTAASEELFWPKIAQKLESFYEDLISGTINSQ